MLPLSNTLSEICFAIISPYPSLESNNLSSIRTDFFHWEMSQHTPKLDQEKV